MNHEVSKDDVPGGVAATAPSETEPPTSPDTAGHVFRSRPATYRLANRQVTFQQALPELVAFRAPDPPVPVPRPRRLPASTPYSFERTFFVADEFRTVECTWARSGCRLRLPRLGEIQIDGAGTFVGWSLAPEATDGDQLRLHQAALGPGLVLALALQGVWCLRAGAIERDTPGLAEVSEAVVFLDEPRSRRNIDRGIDRNIEVGAMAKTVAGLSQDARYLARWRGRRLRLAADEIVPWTLAPTPRLVPHFPQLGHAPDRQPAALVSDDLPLSEIYCLERMDAETAPAESAVHAVNAGSLAEHEAIVTLIRHSVGPRLFSRELLARHFDDLAAAVGTLRTRRLRVSDRPRAVSQILRLVGSDGVDSERALSPPPTPIGWYHPTRIRR